jgi:transglutaminase-like putative cysteine protease
MRRISVAKQESAPGDRMRIHKSLMFGTLLLGSLAPLAAIGQFQAPTVEELKMTSDPKAPGASAVYLYREEREDDSHHFRSVYARIKVLSEAGKDLATVHVVYHKHFVFYATGDNSSRLASATATSWNAPDITHAGEDPRIDANASAGKVEVSAIEGRVIHPDGTIIPLTGAPADLLKAKVTNNQVNELTFTMPDVQVGSIIEYRYQVRYDRFQQAPEWQIQQPYFVHHAHYLFMPADQFLPARNLAGGSAGVSNSAILGSHGETMTDIRSLNVLPPGSAVKQDGQGYYFVDLTDIPAIPIEPYSPPLGAQIYQVNFFYTFTPDAKEFWQKEMGIWMKEVNEYTSPSPLIKSTAQELTAGLSTPQDKAKKLYEAVEKLDNRDFDGNASRYIATDYVPRGNAEATLESKAGNSEELALLYLALARAAGLEARPVRITSRNRRTFQAQLQDTSQLDCVVIGINVDGKEVFADPGEKMAPFQTLHWSHAGTGGVTVGGNGKVELVVTPLQLNTDNRILRIGELKVGADGAVSGTLKVAFTGQDALALRQMALRTDASAVKDRMEKLIQAEVPDGIQAHIDRVAYLDDPEKQLVALVPVSGSFTDHPGKHIVLPRLFFETKETDPFPPEDPRTLPVDMHYPALEQEKITYNLPAGFAVDGKPQDASIKWEDNAAYELKSTAEGNTITTARLLARGFTLLDAADYGKLREFYEKVATADRQQVVLTGAQASK